MSVNPADQPRHGHQAGDLLAGRFRIVRFAGAGGMGEVYEAADEELGGTVAIKTIRADRLERSAAALDRFRDEAKLARRVTHPNVCRVFDVGHDGDRVFITMEFIRGETLANLLKGSGCVPVDAALSLARQMAAGLDALHEQGIVHRDFKTSNVIIADAPSGTQRAVITDFGLARPREETMTIDAQGVPHIMGTPDYMAPEQLTGKPVTTATDVYALGLVLYEMTAGRRPYTGGSAVENAMQRLGERPAPPSRHNAGIPRHWDQVVLRCLERDPGARPASAGEVIAALSGETRLPIRRRVWLLGCSGTRREPGDHDHQRCTRDLSAGAGRVGPLLPAARRGGCAAVVR
jgi:serine/threonine protein kinase